MAFLRSSGKTALTHKGDWKALLLILVTVIMALQLDLF
jgi:hypothetical protein